MTSGEHEINIRQNEKGADVERTDSQQSPLERLRNRVRLIDKFLESINNFEVASGHAELETLLQSYGSETEILSSTEDRQRLVRILEINERIGELTKGLDGNFPKEVSTLHDERSALLEHHDTRFLYEFMSLRESMSDRYESIKNFYSDNTALVDEIGRLAAQKHSGFQAVSINVLRKARLDFTVSDVVVVLPKEEYEKVTKDSLGFHVSGSVVSFAMDRDNPTELAGTIKHEHTHAITEQLVDIEWRQLTNRMVLLDEIEEGQNLRLPRKYAQSALDSLQFELISNLDKYKDAELEHLNQNLEKLFQYALARPSSEGDIADRFVARLDRLSNKELAAKIKVEFMNLCIEQTRELKRLVTISESISQKAMSEVHILTALLPPSQYRYIRRYLLEGEESEEYKTVAYIYDQTVKAKELIRKGFHANDVVTGKQALEVLLGVVESISPADKQYFIGQLSDIEAILPDLWKGDERSLQSAKEVPGMVQTLKERLGNGS